MVSPSPILGLVQALGPVPGRVSEIIHSVLSKMFLQSQDRQNRHGLLMAYWSVAVSVFSDAAVHTSQRAKKYRSKNVFRIGLFIGQLNHQRIEDLSLVSI
jgi:hypothetical protein